MNTDCGENARLVGVIFVPELPKTRSGQVLRSAMKAVAGGATPSLDDYPTIQNFEVLEQLKAAFDAWSEPATESALSEKEGKNRGCF